MSCLFFCLCKREVSTETITFDVKNVLNILDRQMSEKSAQKFSWILLKIAQTLCYIHFVKNMNHAYFTQLYKTNHLSDQIHF